MLGLGVARGMLGLDVSYVKWLGLGVRPGC